MDQNRTSTFLRFAVCLLGLASPGCFLTIPFPGETGGGGGVSTGGGGGSGGAFHISGRLLSGQQAGPDAKVEVRKAGTLLGSVTARAGVFSLDVDPGGPTTLLVTIKAEGITPIARTLKADRVGEVTLEEQVVPLQALVCAGGSCAVGGLRVEGLPSGTTGLARAFNPVVDTNAFPGGFEDSDGNLLLSGAFATVELKDAQGRPLTQLNSPATLRVPFPKDTWPLLVDLVPGNGAVTVPLFYFDETLGTWKREGQGTLVADDGSSIAETEIAAVRARTHAGPLFIAGQVQHFSTWNVDWPISSHGCVAGRIVSAAREPKKDAKVEVEGATYTGHSPLIVTSADGRFCSDVLRSESLEEDVNQDGVRGQAQRVTVFVTAGDEVFDGREHVVPTAAATCGGGCLDLGDIVLDATSQFVTALCTVSGVLTDLTGAPVAGANVTGISTATSEQIHALCPDGSCGFLSKTTASDGSFSGSVAVRDRLTLTAQRFDMPSPRTTRTQAAWLTTRGCPRGPVQLQLGPERLLTELDVFVEGQLISWTPPVLLQSVLVVSAAQNTKWSVITPSPALATPLTFRATPAGSLVLPSTDPGPLTSGDDVVVLGTLQEGAVLHIYSGNLTVP